MPQIFRKDIIVVSLALFFLANMPGISSAALSMDEIRYLFEQETGAQWEAASSEEKRAFVRDVQGREELKEEVNYKGKVEKSNTGSTVPEDSIPSEEKKEKAPFYVRTSFEQRKGISWEDASESEQEEFWRDFIKTEEKQKREEEKLLMEKKRREEKLRQEQEKEKRAIEKKIRIREKEIEKKRRDEEKKRQEEKKRLEKAKIKLEKMRNKSRSNR